MRKIVFTWIAFTVFGLAVHAQDKARTTPFNANGHLQTNITEKSDAGCDGLLTTLEAGNGNDGAMFNIVPNESCKITYFDVLLNGVDTGWVSIYRHIGPYAGHEFVSEDWTLLDSVQMVITTQDALYRIPIYVNQELIPGDTISFYITGHQGIGVDYTDGTTEDSIFAQDSYMEILEGIGMSYPFADDFRPRMLNMIVNYCPLFSFPCADLTTTYELGNNNSGVIFDAVAHQNLTVSEYKAAVEGSGMVYLYTKPGSYLGAEQNAALWTLRDSVQVSGAVSNVPTALDFDPTTIETGDTMAFYLTFSQAVTPSSYFHYTNGDEEGTRVAYDGLFEITAGIGMGALFSEGIATRIFNGTLTYCMNNTTGINELTQTAGVKVYPNPFGSTATLEIENPGQYEALAVSLYDQSGRNVKQWNEVVSGNVTIDRNNLQNGLYLYVVSSKGTPVATGKLIIQ
jgi:hypothetical protein